MINRFAQLRVWTDESIGLCSELERLLHQERAALMRFSSDELVQITMSKEMVVTRLFAIRRQLKDAIKGWYGVESTEQLQGKFDDKQREEWSSQQAKWQSIWSQTCKQAERSQQFLKHSQRNLGRLVDHWRRLLGESPLYCAKGKKVEVSSAGKVLEAQI